MTTLHLPAVIRFGAGMLAAAGEEVRRLGAEDALLLTSVQMPERPAFRTLLHSLEAARVRVRVHARIPAEPGEADLEVARAAAGATPRVIVGLGGGSVLDVAKLVALLATNGGRVDQYYGVHRVPRPGLPTVLLPTTAGSGSEVSQDAVLTDRREGTKRAVKDPKLVAACALVDPEATWTCPPDVTASSGLDALTHAIEALTGTRAGPLSDVPALKAIALLAEHLPRAVRDGGDGPAREALALGATLAGMAFNATGTAAVHACGYPLSGRFGLAHGTANALMLPHVVAFNQPVSPKHRLLEAALHTSDVPEALRRLVARTGLPTRLRDAGVDREALPELAALAATDRRHLDVNPRPVGLADLRELYEQAW